MFIAIVGPPLAGKSSIKEYLVSYKSFVPVRIQNGGVQTDPGMLYESVRVVSYFALGFITPWLLKLILDQESAEPLLFDSPARLLAFITKNWQSNFVTTDLQTRRMVEPFVRRPFFILISVNAPLMERYRRSGSSDLQSFVEQDDEFMFGTGTTDPLGSALHDLSDFVHHQISNTFNSIADFHLHLEGLDLLNPEHTRPGWDAYFMTLASLASHRSNCMKRRVGAILTVPSYNGTARGLPNCNQGGCPRCNATEASPAELCECVCLHAEENALLEAGAARVGANTALYCNTCPCLRCTVKIIQIGVKTVVYNLTYKVDDASASLFKQAGVELRRYSPPRRMSAIIGN
ncbi:cytidine deaminase-like protein [Infundibulicybe gibba]|nr:cytidine deaminase-like protein [Infundibulicybe gibba]